MNNKDKAIVDELKQAITKSPLEKLQLVFGLGSKIEKNRKNYERFNRWRKKHRKLHNLRINHCGRKLRGYYDQLPNKIKYLEQQLKNHKKGIVTVCYSTEWCRLQRGYYKNLPANIKRLKLILSDFKKGKVPRC